MPSVTSAPDRVRQRVFTVGLTGGIGSGKSTVAKEFEKLGVCVIDTDEIAHALTGPDGGAITAIQARFGTEALNPDGSLNRPAMRQKAFSDPHAKLSLEGILHPMIRSEALARLSQVRSGYAMLVVPLLIETGVWQASCDRLLVVDCSEETQIRRVMARNSMPRGEVERILAAQATRQSRLAAATDVIENEGAPETLVPRITALHRQYLLASEKPLCGS